MGIKVQDGLVAFADTRVTTGSECITAKKIKTYGGENWTLFIMTSGLRSIRDKAVTYFEESIDELEQPPSKLFKMVNLFASQVRKVSEEDRQALQSSGFSFNMNALVGGQMADDDEPRLFLIYPEGNWVEIGKGTPYHIIGSAGYGKPVLDRTLQYDDTMRFAAKVGALAFDSTRISAADVDFPLDVAMCVRGSYEISLRRYEKKDLLDMSTHWQDKLRNSVRGLEIVGFDSLIESLPKVPGISVRMKRESS